MVRIDFKSEEALMITGGCGFIGSAVVRHFAATFPRLKIYVLDKLDYCASLENLKEVLDSSYVTFIQGDVCSPDLVNHLLSSLNIKYILHFAAQTHVDNSFGNSFTFTHNNVMGTHVLLEAAKNMGDKLKLFLHVSTDEVYGESKDGAHEIAFRETSVLEPTNPYAATKCAAEQLVKAYYRSFNLPVVITRGNNVYGPGQFPEKLIPKFMSQVQRGLKMTVHGDGSALRNYMYITDCARAFETVVRCGEIGHIYNLGGNSEVSVMEVARDIALLSGTEDVDSCIEHHPDRAFNDQRYFIDCTKLKDMGWSSQVEWKEGLQTTYEWYQKDRSNYWKTAVSKVLSAHPTL